MHLVPLSLRMWKQVCEGALSSSSDLGLREMQSGSRLITPVHGHAQARHTHRPLLWPYVIILKQFKSLKGTGRGSDACLQGRGGLPGAAPAADGRERCRGNSTSPTRQQGPAPGAPPRGPSQRARPRWRLDL